jgi:signal transduction histidine kinase
LEERSDDVILEVTDNGKGITDAEIAHVSSVGLRGMEERALFAGGELQIRGVPGTGTAVKVRIPVRSQRAEPGEIRLEAAGGGR